MHGILGVPFLLLQRREHILVRKHFLGVTENFPFLILQEELVMEEGRRVGVCLYEWVWLLVSVFTEMCVNE